MICYLQGFYHLKEYVLGNQLVVYFVILINIVIM